MWLPIGSTACTTPCPWSITSRPHSGHTVVRDFLLDDALEVDLPFAPTAGFSLWDPIRVLFDRSGRIERIAAIPDEWQPGPPDWSGEAGFAWHDVSHG